jgi:hypothetical protein
MKTRRQFLKGVGLFTILAGAGRIWKVTTIVESPYQFMPNDLDLYAMGQQFKSPLFRFLPSFTDFMREMEKEGRVDANGTITWPPNMGESIQRCVHEIRDLDSITLVPTMRVAIIDETCVMPARIQRALNIIKST